MDDHDQATTGLENLDATVDDVVHEVTEAVPANAGDTLAERYLLIEVLGRGGFGWVFRARDLQLDREVAVKLLRVTAAGSLVQEGKALAQLEHPNIVPVYDAGLVDGLPYLVMGLVSGRPLNDRLKDGKRLSLDETVTILEQVCGALDYAHECGIVHGDIKPANLLLDDKGRARVVDFGIAQFRKDDGAGAMPGISGTLGYMSPEVMEGRRAGPLSDLFAVGAMAYEMLAGHRAFQGKTVQELVESAMGGRPESLERTQTGLPRGLDDVINKALAKAPEDRFPDGRSFVAAIRRLRLGRVVKYAAATVGALALVVGIMGGAAWWTRPLTLDLQLMGERANANGEFIEVVLENNAVLKSGDRFWVADVKPNRDAWLYVWLLDSSAKLAQLFPAEGIDVPQPLRRGHAYEIPPDLRWEFDYRTGAETILVVASREPVPAPDLEALVAQVNDGGSLIAASAADTTRGVGGLVGPAARRTKLEQSVEQLFEERFAFLAKLSLRHD